MTCKKNNEPDKEVKPLSGEEIKTVNGGIKVPVDDEPSWFKKFVDLFFKVKK